LNHLAREDVKTFPSLGKESPNLDEVFGMRYHAWAGARDADRNYNPSWTDALTGALTRLEMRKRDFGEVAHAKIKAILEERLVRARFESMTPDQKNLVLQDRLIDWLVKPEVDKFPLGNKAANNFSEILGVSYGYFVGIGPGSERGTSVNASWTDALTLTLARLKMREATIPKEHFEKAKRILEDRLTWAKGEAMSPAEENIALQDLLVDWLLKPEVKAFPPSTRNRRSDPGSADKPLDAVLGINSQRFVGSDFRGKNLNPSWSEALRGTLARLELRKEKVESTHLEKAKKIVEERLARAIFDELPRAEQNVILQDRLIDWLLKPQTNSFPVTVKDSPDSLSLVLQIHYINFIGRAEKSEHNHNASWSEALERTLVRLGSRKESIVDKIAFAKAKRLLEERLDVANFDKLSTAEQNAILQDRLIDWLLKPEVDTFPVANTRGENTLGAALGAQYNMFVGHETGGVRYNASWTEALLTTLARLESRKDKTGGAAFAKAKKLIEDRLGKARFDELSPEQQNEVLQDRLITWLARPENTEFPTASAHDTGSPRNFSVVLDMNYQRFVGSSKPRSGTSYNASWREALERTLARLESRRGAFEPAVYAKVKGILETKLRAVK
ncbi:MAG TPA: hypothetical protein VM901_06975, partial [Bdellovibrionota bacterium]|nr:hypothetical protein [Bdellovibrionota bacterium]